MKEDVSILLLYRVVVNKIPEHRHMDFILHFTQKYLNCSIEDFLSQVELRGLWSLDNCFPQVFLDPAVSTTVSTLVKSQAPLEMMRWCAGEGEYGGLARAAGRQQVRRGGGQAPGLHQDRGGARGGLTCLLCVEVANIALLQKMWKVRYLETSAKNNININELFEEIFKLEKKRELSLQPKDDSDKKKKKRCIIC